MPSIEDFQFSNIISSSAQEESAAFHRSFLNLMHNYRSDLSTELDSIRRTQQSITKQMSEVDRLAHLTLSSTQARVAHVQSELYSLRHVKNLATTAQKTHETLDRILDTLHTIDAILPPHERLYPKISPHKKHYPRLHLYLQQHPPTNLLSPSNAETRPRNRSLRRRSSTAKTLSQTLANGEYQSGDSSSVKSTRSVESLPKSDAQENLTKPAKIPKPDTHLESNEARPEATQIKLQTATPLLDQPKSIPDHQNEDAESENVTLLSKVISVPTIYTSPDSFNTASPKTLGSAVISHDSVSLESTVETSLANSHPHTSEDTETVETALKPENSDKDQERLDLNETKNGVENDTESSLDGQKLDTFSQETESQFSKGLNHVDDGIQLNSENTVDVQNDKSTRSETENQVEPENGTLSEFENSSAIVADTNSTVESHSSGMNGDDTDDVNSSKENVEITPDNNDSLEEVIPPVLESVESSKPLELFEPSKTDNSQEDVLQKDDTQETTNELEVEESESAQNDEVVLETEIETDLETVNDTQHQETNITNLLEETDQVNSKVESKTNADAQVEDVPEVAAKTSFTFDNESRPEVEVTSATDVNKSKPNPTESLLATRTDTVESIDQLPSEFLQATSAPATATVEITVSDASAPFDSLVNESASPTTSEYSSSSFKRAVSASYSAESSRVLQNLLERQNSIPNLQNSEGASTRLRRANTQSSIDPSRKLSFNLKQIWPWNNTFPEESESATSVQPLQDSNQESNDIRASLPTSTFTNSNLSPSTSSSNLDKSTAALKSLQIIINKDNEVQQR